MICAQTQTASPIDGSQVVAVPKSQPSDLSTCAIVLVTGQELSAISGISFPSPADFGATWALGFTLVVGSYCVAWGIGVVLRFIRN